MLDRRRVPRFTARGATRIDLNPRWPTIDCNLRNLNKFGACVEIAPEFNTSVEFDLIFHSGRERRRCRQIWRDDNRLGVEFIEPSRTRRDSARVPGCR